MSEMKELREGWLKTTLGEVCKLKNGYAFKSTDYIKDAGIPVVRISDIGEGKVILENCVRVNEDSEYENYVVYKDDILVAMSGATTGKFGIFKNEEKAYQNQRVGKFQKLYNEVIDNSYLFYLLYSLKRAILKDAYGGAQPNISSGKIERLSILLPPLPEQHRIVAKIEELFSSLDKGIESLKTAQAQLKTYRQAVLKWAFEGKLTNENVKEGELPEGWKWVKIEDIAESLDYLRKPINKAERLKRAGTIPYYGANGRTGWIDDYLFDEPLILVVEDETFVGRRLPFSYKITGKAWVNNHAHILRPKKSLHIDFLNYQLAYYPFLVLTTGTTGRKKLTKNALMNAPFKVCPLAEQHRIVSEIETRLSVCDKLEENITQSLVQAEALRQSILKKAFEGKLVPQNPNDEPAGILLDRIRAERTSTAVKKMTSNKRKKRLK